MTTTAAPPVADITAETICEAARPVRITSAANEIVDPRSGLPARVVDLAPPGWTIHEASTAELLDALPFPVRAKGTVEVDSGSDLITAVRHRHDGETDVPLSVYGDPRDLTITAVLNDDHAGGPGHADHRVVAQLRRTPEWEAWRTGQGLQAQERFAEFIEDHLEDILDPEPLTMLELAQSFQAHTSARFSVSARLASGAVALNYVEDQDVSAGDGNIEIPAEFTIAVRPFYGVDRFSVKARFRYRVGRGELQLGWKLNRPEDIEAQVFDEQLATVGDALAVEPVHGRR